MRRSLLLWGSLALAWACRTAAAPTPAVSPSPVETTPTPAEPGRAELPQAVLMLERLRREDPQHGAARYVLARFYAARGDHEVALLRLRELVAIEGWDYTLAFVDFPSLVDDPQAQEIAATLAARAPAIGHGPVAFELDALDLLPEGVAWDPTRRELLVGSMAKRQILAADAHGVTRVVVPSAQGGLTGVLGITVDAARDEVWAAAVVMPAMQGYDAQADAGASAVFAFSLVDGAARGQWPAPAGPSQLNDLVALADGTVLVTDSVTGALLRKAPGAASGTPLVPLLPADTFFAPNGIVELSGEAAVLVADFHGLHRVRLDDASVVPLRAPAGVSTLGGIDGLERHGSTLYAIQNVFGQGRVWALRLDEQERAIVEARILDDDHPRYVGPTTGAIAGDRFLYLANASLQLGADGGLAPAPSGVRHAILSLPLR